MGEVIALRAGCPVRTAGHHTRQAQLGRMIRQARGELTQAQFGGMVGVGQPAVSAWEAGKVGLTTEVLWAIETTLGLQHGWLSVASGLVDPGLDPLVVLLEASLNTRRSAREDA